MKKPIIHCFLLVSCLILVCCQKNHNEIPETDYREEMRSLVQQISAYARNTEPSFVIIPQNGQELITEDGQPDGQPVSTYINSIDGVGREDLFYGYTGDNMATPNEEILYMTTFLDLCKQYHVQVLTTDYCFSFDKIDDSYAKNELRGYISFATPYRELDCIPPYPAKPYRENTDHITSLLQARNFLYLINPGKFNSRAGFLDSLMSTNYDLLLIDCFFQDVALAPLEVDLLKTKQNGSRRMVISYLSIGEAENYRYYWKHEWEANPPSWLGSYNPEWPDNYAVQYWKQEWKTILFGNDSAYLPRIIAAGFDGVYLDGIDAFENFEE